MSIEYEQAKIGYQECLKNYLHILLIKIFRAYFIKDDQKTNKNIRTTITDFVMAYLQKSPIGQNIQIDELAKQAFYSSQHFRKLFKDESGVTLSSFIREQRLSNACDLLVETDLTVLNIMEQTGFNDTKSFYSAFRKLKNMTPAQYRSKYQKK
jgi:AraC-like DNA-binding protein